MLNITVTTGSVQELQQAAREIAGFVRMDTTGPTPDNRDAWVSDLALRNELEQPIGRELKRWDWVLIICGGAIQMMRTAKSPSSAQALVCLMALNAARRLLKPDHQQVERFIAEAQGLLEHVEPGVHRMRLESLLDYHIGIWARTIGDYQLSIDHQIRAAKSAHDAGDIVGEAISLFCKEVEMVSLAIQKDVKISLEHLVDHAKRVVKLCRDSTDKIRKDWALCNAPIHVLLAHIWTKTPLPFKEQKFWLDLLMELSQKDKKGYSNTQATISACYAGVEIYQQAIVLAEPVIDEVGRGDEQALMTARWVIACASKACGDGPHAYQHMSAIVADGHSMHQLRALAKRELKNIS